MALSHFKEIVEQFAAKKFAGTEEKLHDYEKGYIRDIERELDNEEITIGEAIKELKNRMKKKLGYDDRDYNEIKKALERNGVGKKEE
jgi:hypothetical protein